MEKRNHRVPARSTRARVSGSELPVINLSLGGACLAVADGIDAPSPFTLELQHPHFADAAAVQAEVVWSAPQARAGVRFLDLDPEQRRLVRRCMLAEYGHAVLAAGATRPVGYVVPKKPGLWGVYDQDVTEVAQLRREDGRLFLGLDGKDLPAPGLPFALARAFRLARSPSLDPPLDITKDPGPPEPPPPPVKRPPPLTGSSVRAAGRAVGFVARTGESWSFFDAGRDPLGFMTLAGGEWRVVVLGTNDDGSLDLRRAPTYPEALAAAFSLAAPPELRSAVFQPTSLLDV